jgi:hypothetical protein
MCLPQEWAGDASRRKKTHVPDDIAFLTKPQIALVLIDEAIADGIAVKAWTFDEFYGRDGKFLDGLDERKQAFVGEVPPNFTMWTRKPKVLQKPPRNRNGRPKKYPRLAAREAKPCEVQNLAKYSPGLASQTPQRYRVRDSHKGPEDIRCINLPPRIRQREYEAELARIGYHQTRNAEASRCHWKRRLADYHDMGIDPDQIKSVDPKTP